MSLLCLAEPCLARKYPEACMQHTLQMACLGRSKHHIRPHLHFSADKLSFCLQILQDSGWGLGRTWHYLPITAKCWHPAAVTIRVYSCSLPSILQTHKLTRQIIAAASFMQDSKLISLAQPSPLIEPAYAQQAVTWRQAMHGSGFL